MSAKKMASKSPGKASASRAINALLEKERIAKLAEEASERNLWLKKIRLLAQTNLLEILTGIQESAEKGNHYFDAPGLANLHHRYAEEAAETYFTEIKDDLPEVSIRIKEEQCSLNGGCRIFAQFVW